MARLLKSNIAVFIVVAVSCKGQSQREEGAAKDEKRIPATNLSSSVELTPAEIQNFYALDSDDEQTLFKQLQGFWVMPVAPALTEAWEVVDKTVKVFDKQGRQEELALSFSSPCTLELTKNLSDTEVKRRYSFTILETETTTELRMGGWVGTKKNGATILCNADRIIIAREGDCTEFSHRFSTLKEPNPVDCSFDEEALRTKAHTVTLSNNSAFDDSALKAERKKSFNQAKESL